MAGPEEKRIQEIREAVASGDDAGLKGLRYDTVQKRFVTAPDGEPQSGGLLSITPEDMKVAGARG